MEKLAIIIPAFKADFLRETLQSIARQSDKRFSLYIGDDASPHDLLEIIRPFVNEIDLRYHRFETNLGGTDLVAHWNRCIELSEGEEWIWLFSDDDVMDRSCVAAFYKYVEAHGETVGDLLHFDLEVINEHGDRIWPVIPFGHCIDYTEFVTRRIGGNLHSTGVEYIFRRKRWEEVGGFESFDLAWCSDDATWIKLSENGGIQTIPDTRVKWRFSDRNISSKHANAAIIRRKVDASVAYVHWLRNYFERRRLRDRPSLYRTAQWVMTVPLNATALAAKTKVRYATHVASSLGLKGIWRVWLVVHATYRTLKIGLASIVKAYGDRIGRDDDADR